MNERGIVASFIAITIVAFFCGLVTLLAFHNIPAENQRFIDGALGGLVVQFANIVGYYFGSSRDAAKNAERLAATTPAAPSPTVAQATAEPEKKP